MLQRFLDRWVRPACETTSLDLLLRLTVLEILMRPMGFWAIRPLLLLLAALSLLKPSVLRAPATWIALTLLVVWRLIDDWPLSDNHIYLLCYWCLALFLALISTRCEESASKSARLLLGLAFAFAVLWKGALSDDYLDGRFFRITLLQDERFSHSTMLFGGLTEQQLIDNRKYLNPLPEGAERVKPLKLIEPASFQSLVKISTWGALLLEGLVALALLIPLPGKLRNVRHVLLLLFCVVTYAFAPVAGFGWLVLVMGMAQCDPQQKIWRSMYWIAYLLVFLYSEIPWSQLVPRGRAIAGYNFEFVAERQFNFFLVQIILPMILVVGMSWIVFWLDPNQPGSRVSISITSMLTVVAYRLLLGNFLPRLSFLTRMDYFVFGCTFLVFSSLVSVVAINHILTKKKEKLAYSLDKIARWIFPALFIILTINCFVL